MNKITCTKVIAISLLLLSLFLPLIGLIVSDQDKALCAKDPRCKIPVSYAYENIISITNSIVTSSPEIYLNCAYLFLYFSVFILPLLSLLLKPFPQSIVVLLGSIPSFYALYIFVVGYNPLIGTWLAFLSWVFLLSISLFTFWQHFTYKQQKQRTSSAPTL